MALFRCGAQSESVKHIVSVYMQFNSRLDGLSPTQCNIYSSLLPVWDSESGGNVHDSPTDNAGGQYSDSDFIAAGGCLPRHGCFNFIKVNYSDGTSDEYGNFHGSRIVTQSESPTEEFITRNECETDECPVVADEYASVTIPYYNAN